MQIIANKINADGDNLYSRKNMKVAKKMLKYFDNYLYYNTMGNYKWLDVGAGDNYLRSLITHLKMETSNIDLDYEKYPYYDGEMSLITSFNVIEHLYNPLFHLKEVHRVLSKRGDFILVTCNDYSLIYKFEHLFSRKYKPHFHQFSEYDLRCILERAGFNIISFKKTTYGTGTLARISRNMFFIHASKL